jgi:hypothetical protein
MPKLSPEAEERKKAIFDTMSPRVQKHILKKGYEVWDPFQEPKDPIELRDQKQNLTARQIARSFLAACDFSEYSNAFGQGAWEICLGLVNEDERYMGMYAFSIWYDKEKQKLKEEQEKK